MKLILVLFSALALCLNASAALDTYDSVTVKVLANPVAVNAANATNAAVDIAGCKGIANLLVIGSAAYTNAAGYTNTITVQKSDASAGTYTTVTSAVFTAATGTGSVSSIKLDAGSLSRYLRVIVATKGDTGAGGALLLYSK